MHIELRNLRSITTALSTLTLNQLTLRILSMVFFRFSAVNGGPPVSMSNINAPKLHQSTAFPWPHRIRISGAMYSAMSSTFLDKKKKLQKFCKASMTVKSGKCIDNRKQSAISCARHIEMLMHKGFLQFVGEDGGVVRPSPDPLTRLVVIQYCPRVSILWNEPFCTLLRCFWSEDNPPLLFTGRSIVKNEQMVVKTIQNRKT